MIWRQERKILVLTAVLPFIVVLLHRGSSFTEHRLSPERTAIGTLKMILQAEASFHISNQRYGTFEELVIAEELSPEWVKPVRDGYLYSIIPAAHSAILFARPIEYGPTRRLSFCLVYNDLDKDPLRIRGTDRRGWEAKLSDPFIDSLSIP
ncbi:MAG TPA: hypothetical protein VFC63_24725 [Blastocatellia bacterium]|nr:hypothetical protein [Blastocatellia bacterium]